MSLLPILSKIVEEIVSNQLLHFLLKSNIFFKQSAWFQTQSFCKIISAADAFYRNMDNKIISLLTLRVLSKAFDSVNHFILLKKCVILNINSWLNSYIKNRT